MLVVRAEHLGMCFGVKDALETIVNLPDPGKVTIHGELVHNEVVTDRLDALGFHQQSESTRSTKIPTPEVVITAHGVSNQRKASLLEAGYLVHDTTCPLVRRVHKTALHYQQRGFHIIVLGRKGHVEVEGLVGDLSSYTIMSHLDDVRPVEAERIAVINQTTMPPEKLRQLHQAIRAVQGTKEVVIADTTCRPTRDRQRAVLALLERVDGLVVVGGSNSNNTLQLGERATERGIPWWRVANVSELRAEYFEGHRVLGLTAGTSTTEQTVREVEKFLRALKVRKISA